MYSRWLAAMCSMNRFDCFVCTLQLQAAKKTHVHHVFRDHFVHCWRIFLLNWPDKHQTKQILCIFLFLLRFEHYTVIGHRCKANFFRLFFFPTLATVFYYLIQCIMQWLWPIVVDSAFYSLILSMYVLVFFRKFFVVG